MFLVSERVCDVLNGNEDYYGMELDAYQKIEQAKLLANIYIQNSTKNLSNVDYKNIYDICYLLCINDYESSNHRNRMKFAKEKVKKVKENDKSLYWIMTELLIK